MRAAVPWFRHNTISHLVRPLGFEPRTCGLNVNRPLPSLAEALPSNTGALAGARYWRYMDSRCDLVCARRRWRLAMLMLGYDTNSLDSSSGSRPWHSRSMLRLRREARVGAQLVVS